MSEFISVKKKAPPNNEWVEVLCDDFRGEYTRIAKRLDYKAGSTRSQLRRIWRWIDSDGNPLGRKNAPSGWRSIK